MKFDFSKYPKDIPWGPLVTLSLSGIALSAYFILNDLDRPNWVLPPENQLQYARGTFLPKQPAGPYVFRMDNGSNLSLGCQPQGLGVECFDQDGDRTSHSVSVGYFYIYNVKRPRLSNILVTVSSDDRKLLSYSDRKRQIDEWARRERSLPRLFAIFALDLLPIIVCVGIAFAAFRSRLNRYKASQDAPNPAPVGNGGPWA